MLRRNTLFVVGAGASFDFGFPLGSELVALIREELSGRSDASSPYLGSPEVKNAIELIAYETTQNFDDVYWAGQKLASILANYPVSIDNVIATHSKDPNLVAVAKLVIAKVLLQREKQSKLTTLAGNGLRNSQFDKNNWLNFCLQRMFTQSPGGDTLDVFSKAHFISFNYDRCIRQIARRALASYFYLDDFDAISACDRLEITHPYGSLGELPNTAHGGETGFGQNVNAETIVKMSRNIKTFTEGIAETDIKKEIDEATKWAESIVFVGFGYIDENLKLLQSSSLKSNQRCVFGSACGMTYASSRAAMSELKERFNAASVSDLDIQKDAMAFVQEHEKSIFH